MAPPTKRRKRNVLTSSDESDLEATESDSRLKPQLRSLPSNSEEEKHQTSRKSPRQQRNLASGPQSRSKTTDQLPNPTALGLPKRPRHTKARDKSASTSPEKAKRKAKTEEQGQNASLFTFFTKQALRQQENAPSNGDASNSKARLRPIHDDRSEDVDIISDGDDVGEATAQSGSLVGLVARKRLKRRDPFRSGEIEQPSASQKFLRNPVVPADSKNADDTRPWAERFAPLNLEELAVHKRKVADVRQWLEDVISGRRRQRLLLLKGAAGTGKTATVQLLSKDMNLDILEWRNPVGSMASSDGSLSMAAQFEDLWVEEVDLGSWKSLLRIIQTHQKRMLRLWIVEKELFSSKSFPTHSLDPRQPCSLSDPLYYNF